MHAVRPHPVTPVALLALLAACGDTAAPGDGGPPEVALRLTPIVDGLVAPVLLTAPPGDPRLFIVQQGGRIRIIEDGVLLPAPFLDLSDRVRFAGEQGLLGLAFHPAYGANGTFVVDYIDASGDTRVERYRVSADPDLADPSSARLILAVDQPFANHNGGLVAFGPDGMLYIGLGDGGGGGDPLGNGQDLNTLLGSLLRIDIDGGDPYAIPAGNPFARVAAARPEIWAYGLRNPWRFAFDAPSGTLFIGDVGQNQYEEVNAVPAATAGVNYGWNVMEGRHCFGAGGCSQNGLTLPVLEYDHGEGCSVIGGLVYRGRSIPEIVGHYFYGDLCGWVRSFRWTGSEATDRAEWDFGDIGNVLSFGEDGAGELYVLSSNGRVYRLEAVR